MVSLGSIWLSVCLYVSLWLSMCLYGAFKGQLRGGYGAAMGRYGALWGAPPPAALLRYAKPSGEGHAAESNSYQWAPSEGGAADLWGGYGGPQSRQSTAGPLPTPRIAALTP